MTLRELVTTLKHRWYVVAAFLVLGIAGAFAWNATRTPIYTSTSQMLVSTTTASANISALQSGSDFSQSMVTSYAAIVTNAGVMDRVIRELSLPYTSGQLADEIAVTNPDRTVLLNVEVSDPDPARAASIANTVAQVFPAFVTQLSNPAGSTPSPVRISQSNPAVAGVVPVSPNKNLNLAYGMLLGLVLGAGAVVLRKQLNTSVSSAEDVEKATGAVPLGVVPFDRTTRDHPLIESSDNGARGEAFRSLRTNLQFANVDAPPRLIVVTSALAGEGKSTTAANIALTLALGGATVILVEGDLRKPALSGYLKVGRSAGMTTVLAGQASLRDVVLPHSVDGLFVLPSGPLPPNPSELLGSQQMNALMTTLTEHFEYIVIDAPPLLPVTDAAVMAGKADGAVLVVRHGKTSRENLAQAVQALKAVDAQVLGTVLNFAPLKRMGRGAAAYGYGVEPRPEARSGRPFEAEPPAPPVRPESRPEPRPEYTPVDRTTS